MDSNVANCIAGAISAGSSPAAPWLTLTDSFLLKGKGRVRGVRDIRGLLLP